jgi:hypothetical protein
MFPQLQPEGIEQALITIAEIEYARLQEPTELGNAAEQIGQALPEGLEHVLLELVK